MASYKQAIQWVSENDDVSEILDGDLIEATRVMPVTLSMIADLWGKESVRVVKDVRNRNRKAMSS